MLLLSVLLQLILPLPVQNTVVEEVQQLPWRLCYARDKAQPAPTAAASAGADALQVDIYALTHHSVCLSRRDSYTGVLDCRAPPAPTAVSLTCEKTPSIQPPVFSCWQPHHHPGAA